MATTAPRRWIVCCDGTWVNSDDDPLIPTNVTRLYRALNAASRRSQGPSQTAYYHRGIGTGGNFVSKFVGGGTGDEISAHVRECYDFLCGNYRLGDDILLFGFSRGAYTARVIASLISDVGLLTATGMEFFYEIFEDWKNQNVPAAADKQQQTDITDGPFKGSSSRPKMPSPEYRAVLQARGYCLPDVPIKCIGVFDTVGALGVPPVAGLNLSSMEAKQYSFVNTKVARGVVHAFQALGLDEHRAAFSPCLWETPDHSQNFKSLKQVWFPGVHCSVGGGGGYEDQGVANIALAWMVNQLRTIEQGGLVDFDDNYLKWVYQRNVDHCNSYYIGTEKDQAGHVVKDNSGFRGWALGRIEESMTTLYQLVGTSDSWAGSLPNQVTSWFKPGDLPRTPGDYDEVDAVGEGGDSVKTGQKLRNTNERVHSSVRVRTAMPYAKSVMVKGAETDGYIAKAMEKWRLIGGGGGRPANDPLATSYRWQSPDASYALPEEPLSDFEKVLLDMSNYATPLRS